MTRKHSSIDRLSSIPLQQAQREVAMMQRDMNKLRASMAGLHRGIHVPTVKPSHLKTHRTVNAPFTVFGLNGGSLLNMAVGDALSMVGLAGGYTSAAQSLGRNLAMMTLGQRIR